MAASTHRAGMSPVGSESVPAAPAAGAAAMPALPLSACASRAGCAAAGHDSACAPRHASSAINQGRESEGEPEYTSAGGAADAADELALLPSEAGARRASGGDQLSVLSPPGAPETLYPPEEPGHEEKKEPQKDRRPPGRGAKMRRAEKRLREGISAAQPARMTARATQSNLPPPVPRLVPPPHPPPGPPPPWSVPVPHMPPTAPLIRGQSRHLTWINPAAPPARPPSRVAAHPRAAQHPIARARQRASNAIAVAARATLGAQAVAQLAAQIADAATRIAAKRSALAAGAASPSLSGPALSLSSRADHCPAAVRFEGPEVPPTVKGVKDMELIEEILEGQFVFIRTDDVCDGVPVYVLEEDIIGDMGDMGDEVVLYRVPSGMVLNGNVPGMFWSVRLGDSYLAYGIDRRMSDERSDPCFCESGCVSWYVGDYTRMRETDIEVPGFHIVNVLPANWSTRAALENEHC
jgi:hypothetical protein